MRVLYHIPHGSYTGLDVLMLGWSNESPAFTTFRTEFIHKLVSISYVTHGRHMSVPWITMSIVPLHGEDFRIQGRGLLSWSKGQFSSKIPVIFDFDW